MTRLPALALPTLLLACCLLTLAGHAAQALSVPAAPGILVLASDFGLHNEAVGLCHGAALAVDPRLTIVDLCHTVRPFDVRQASLMLGRTDVFPAGTVFVAVVDPGVGTARGAIALRTRQGRLYVAPDNGLLTEVIARQGVEAAVRLDPRRVNPRWRRGTFDGRDLFSPAGALLASGKAGLATLGTALRPADLVRLPALKARVRAADGAIIGHFLRTDEPYGNAWTDVPARDLDRLGIRPGTMLEVEAKGQRLAVPFVEAFGDVPEGKPLAYLGSDGTLAFALNMGDFVRTQAWTEGLEITVRMAR
ncbi:MAG: SAM-dependent chlorinase/fluorinase [Candidatus Riflebacteria bacterium]|nr:SAM-dependent chlorinase/fluorinase [Candidatus Riflebacteria bacterium]